MMQNVNNQRYDHTIKGSTEALLEVFCYAQKVLSGLLNIPVHSETENGPSELQLLVRENERLKDELAKLDQMIEEKL